MHVVHTFSFSFDNPIKSFVIQQASYPESIATFPAVRYKIHAIYMSKLTIVQVTIPFAILPGFSFLYNLINTSCIL